MMKHTLGLRKIGCWKSNIGYAIHFDRRSHQRAHLSSIRTRESEHVQFDIEGCAFVLIPSPITQPVAPARQVGAAKAGLRGGMMS
jgi:hypothetical protein